MSSDQESRKIWKRPALLISCVVLLSISSVLCLLRFGNPQWHKRIYMFQAYVWPQIITGRLAPGGIGSTFSETHWHSNGRKMGEKHIKNGTGMQVWWHDNGQKSNESHYLNGLKHGTWIEWDKNGKTTKVEHYEHGELARTDEEEPPNQRIQPTAKQRGG